MSTPEAGPSPRPSRRGLIIGLAALVVIGLAGAGYYGYQRYTASQPGDVNTPSPLGDMALGPADARVKIIEYASMTCPHCAAFTKETFPNLKATYIDTGKVRYIFREYPLDEVAFLGAILARCIAKGDPAKFFNVIDVLFASQNEWASNAPVEPLKRITKQLGLNDQEFQACVDNRAISQGIIETRDYAFDRLKVNATPTFFINGQLLQGEASLEEFAKIIDPLLARQAAPATPPKS
jgi:protein-disulfide isomerase